MAAEKLHRSSGGLAALLKSISAAVGEGAQIVFESFFLTQIFPTGKIYYCSAVTNLLSTAGRWRLWMSHYLQAARLSRWCSGEGICNTCWGGGRVKSQEARGEDRQQLMGSLSFCVYCRGQSGPWGPALELPRGDYLHYSHNTNLISSWNVRAPSQPVIRGPQRLTETCGKVLERGKERLESNETVTSLTGRRDLKLV